MILTHLDLQRYTYICVGLCQLPIYAQGPVPVKCYTVHVYKSVDNRTLVVYSIHELILDMCLIHTN